MIKILIVDDSETETAILKTLFAAEKDFEIVGYAKNGKEAVNLASLLKPDLITMDIHMPVMDGLEATRIIMSQNPVPIVVISSRLNNESMNNSFLALEAGALSVLDKPNNLLSSQFKHTKRKIIDTVRSMAEIKVIKRRFNFKPAKAKISEKPKTISLNTAKLADHYELIAIGASVGGPQALKTIFEKLGSDFPLPIVVVQHMTNGFITGFAKWLNKNTDLNVLTAENNQMLEKGHVYFAPDDTHMHVNRRSDDLILKLLPGKPVSGFYPSVTVLFQSVAKTCGQNAVGVLLTGMGNDGAKGLLDLKHANAHTIIQDKESAIVFGMAGVAQSLGSVDIVVPLDQMADYLTKISKR